MNLVFTVGFSKNREISQKLPKFSKFPKPLQNFQPNVLRTACHHHPVAITTEAMQHRQYLQQHLNYGPGCRTSRGESYGDTETICYPLLLLL